jgi:hypothetical protein
MTASFLDAQVSQLPTSYRKEAVTVAREQGTMQNAIQLSKSNALNYGQNHREAV